MTNKIKKSNKLREAIIDANPGLMKLEEGCQAKFNGGDVFSKGVVTIIYKDFDDNGYIEFTVINESGFTENIPCCFFNNDNILGKDPTIAHVLVAINKNSSNWYKLSIRPYYPKSLQFEKEGKLKAIWDLTNDSLSYHEKHKPETIEYLEKLLT